MQDKEGRATNDITLVWQLLSKEQPGQVLKK